MASIATYGVFKHGQNIHQQSIIYGPHNDIVLHEEISSTSESEDDRRRLAIIQPITPVNLPGREQRPPPSQRRSDGEAAGYIVEFGTRKKAGVRRRRRFVNDYFLDQQMHTQMPDNLEEAREQWHALFAPQRESIIQQIFEDQEAERAIRPFLDVTIEKEKRLLSRLERSLNTLVKQQTGMKQNAEMKATDKECPTFRFGQIPRNLQVELRHAVDSPELLELQNVIVDYLLSAAQAQGDIDVLEVRLNTAYQRLLAHGMAMYYNMRSHSEDIRSSIGGAPQRRTYMKCKKKTGTQLPRVHLVEYLQGITYKSGYFSYGEGAQQTATNNKKYRKRTSNRSP